MAYHYTEAGLPEQSVPYWYQAGQQAVQRSAYLEAIQHLTAALTQLQTLAETPERLQQELALRIALGPPLTTTRGWGAPALGDNYSRARELHQQVGETAQQFPVLWGLWAFHLVRT